jgi:hypothetical protein
MGTAGQSRTIQKMKILLRPLRARQSISIPLRHVFHDPPAFIAHDKGDIVYSRLEQCRDLEVKNGVVAKTQ